MKKFMVIYTAPKSAMEEMGKISPEEMKKVMEHWMDWAKKCGDSLVDLGTPLIDGQKLTKSGSSKSDSSIRMYSILQAEDMEGAKALLMDHPHLEWPEGAEIEIFESKPIKDY